MDLATFELEKKFIPEMKWTACRSYVRVANLYGSELWWLKESEIGILRRTERSTVRAMRGAQFKDRKRAKDLMFILCSSETEDRLAVANSVCWHVHVLRTALDFKVEGQRVNWRLNRTWKK